MRVNKVVRKTIVRGPETGTPGTNVAAGISAVVSANVGDEAGSGSNQVSSRQNVQIVQRGGRSSSVQQDSESSN